MKKENAIILMVVGVLVGFIAGVGAGIRFASKDVLPSAAAPAASEPGKAPSGEEIRVLEGVLAKDPANLQALIDLGNRYFDGRQFQKAVDMYARALKIDPGNSDVRTDMAIMLRGLKEYDRAVSELKQAAAMDPNHVNSRYNLGIVLLHDKGDVKGAIAAWEDCLKAGATGDQAEKIREQLKRLRSLPDQIPR